VECALGGQGAEERHQEGLTEQGGRESRRPRARSVSAVARVGRSGREDNKSAGQEDAYQSRRSRDVAGESGSARRRVRQWGV